MTALALTPAVLSLLLLADWLAGERLPSRGGHSRG